MSDNTLTATDATFTDIVNGEKPVLVDFWAEWCGPCRVIAPVLEEIATEHEGFNIGKLNVDHNPQTAAAHDVMSIPTLILFKDGVEKKRIVGAAPKHKLMADLEEYVTV